MGWISDVGTKAFTTIVAQISSAGFVHRIELDGDLDVAEGRPASTLGVRGLDSGGYSNEREKEEKGGLYTAGV
jgi:hypothetical protein